MNKIDLSNKTILVTGAAGFIGSNLVKRLFKDLSGATIVGIDNMNDYYDPTLKEYRLQELDNIASSSLTNTSDYPLNPKNPCSNKWIFVRGDIADKSAIDALFNELFMIPDTDKLVLPCLLSLYDLGIIEIGIIDDHTRLSEVRLSELSLTELGLRMQREGILPGQRNESTDKISYDIKNGCLVDPSTRGQEEPFGIPVISPEVCSNIGFPIALIHEWLAEQQGKENRKLMWLDKTTTIESITPVKSQLMWKSSSRQIQLKKGLVWHIADNNDVALDEKSLNDSDFGCPEVYHSLPYSEIDDPDTQIRQIASFRDADSLVSALAAENGVVFADINHFDPNCRFGTDKKSSVCIGVIWGAESFRSSPHPSSANPVSSPQAPRRGTHNPDGRRAASCP